MSLSQDDIFSAAEPALRVLLAALVDGVDGQVRRGILDLTFHIVPAESYRNNALRAQWVAEAEAGQMASEDLLGGLWKELGWTW